MTSDDPAPSLVTIDGIEGHLARVELPDGTTEDWSLANLPAGVREGDVVRLHVEGGDLEVEIDHVETARRHQGAQAQLNDLNRPSVAGEEIDL